MLWNIAGDIKIGRKLGRECGLDSSGSGYGPVVSFYEHANEHSCPIKGGGTFSILAIIMFSRRAQKYGGQTCGCGTAAVATFHTRTHVADTNAASSNTNVDQTQVSTADSNFQSRGFSPSRQVLARSAEQPGQWNYFTKTETSASMKGHWGC
jgi:hypothetical protein